MLAGPARVSAPRLVRQHGGESGYAAFWDGVITKAVLVRWARDPSRQTVFRVHSEASQPQFIGRNRRDNVAKAHSLARVQREASDQKARLSRWAFLLAKGGSGRLLDLGFLGLAFFGLAAERAFLQLRFDHFQRLRLGQLLHDKDFARHAIERGLVELPFGVGLLGLRIGAVEIAYHFGDRL